MKKYWSSICLLICCVLSICRQENCCASENQRQSVEVVLLIDTSQSMDEQMDGLFSWSRDFCRNCIDKNIVLSYVTFDNRRDEKVIIEPTKINMGTYEKCKDKIKEKTDKCKSEKKGIKRLYTDQLGAFKKAEGILGKSDADIKYIIMLSDGELDYDNKDTLISEEREAICELKKRCMEFIDANQKIILVGFGEHIELFQSIIDKEKENGTSFIEYINSNRDPAGVVNKFLSGIGNSETVIEKGKREGVDEISFELEKEHDSVDILIKNESNDKVDFNKGISVYYNAGKGEKLLKEENLLIEPDGERLNIVLTYTKPGNYRISLPNKGTWKYKISYWCTNVKKVTLSLFNNKKEVERKEEDGIICYRTNIFQDSLKLKAKLKKSDKVKVKGVFYLNTNKSADKDIKELWSDKSKVKEMNENPNDEGSEWIYKLQLPLSESNNIYQVRVFLDNGLYINTNKIKIVSKKVNLKDIPVIDKKIGNKIKLEELVQEYYEDYADYIKKMKFIVRKDDTSNDIKDEEYNFDENKKEVVFEETGEYIIEMQKAGGGTFAMVKINAKNDKLYKLKKMICENKVIRNSIFIVAGILVVLLLVVKAIKGTKK